MKPAAPVTRIFNAVSEPRRQSRASDASFGNTYLMSIEHVFALAERP